MYNVTIAYLLWFISGFGALGLHRFYLGKFPTGALWLITGGLGMIGAIYDMFTLPSQVREANLRLRYRQEAEYGFVPNRYEPVTVQRPQEKTESLEHIILRVAKTNSGVVTPSTVALEGDVSMEEAKAQLEDFVDKGFAEMRVRKNGSLAYAFPEFMTPESEAQFESF
ncbi:MAG: TM2 domain-containing protein [Spirochaetia bacterium]